MNKELEVRDAQVLWQERLSDKCKFRRAQICTIYTQIRKQDERYCNLLDCPILYKAQLKLINKFIDMKR